MTSSLLLIGTVAGAALLAAVGLSLRRASALSKLIAHARKTGDASAVAEALGASPPASQPDRFNRTIRQLWDDYERELATQLIRELARRQPDAPIAQYWLDQALRVEPEIAREALDSEFIEQHFNPELAARCGQFG